MKLSPTRVEIALVASTLTIWLVCSLMVQLFPDMMLNLTSHMFHIDMSQIGWEMSPIGALIGGIAWVIFAVVFGWLYAVAYNLYARQ